MDPSSGRSRRVRLPDELLDALWAGLPALGERAVSEVMNEVPAYRGTAGGTLWRVITHFVQETMTGFIELTRAEADPDTSPSIMRLLDLSYALGQEEARQGRSPEVQLAAFRVGARTLWREWSAVAMAQQVPSETLVVFAELIFAYLDRMSAAGVAGQAAEQARLGVARQRHREELARLLVRGSPAGDLAQAAERAGWRPPETLTAVATPRRRRATAVTAWTDPRALDVPDDAVPPSVRSYSTALIPGVGGRAREPFITSLSIPGTVIGPARPWMHVDTSVRRLSRAIVLNLPHTGVIDTERYLPELVLSADTEALADLRADVLAPLQSLTPAARNRLTETLRSWLLNHGRREDIGADLYVHPSTVRYRVRQLRELFGDRLHDSRAIMELTIALATPPPPKP
jgi:hypothetical protein